MFTSVYSLLYLGSFVLVAPAAKFERSSKEKEKIPTMSIYKQLWLMSFWIVWITIFLKIYPMLEIIATY